MESELLQKYKDKYWSIFSIQICDIDFICREISRGEFNDLKRKYGTSLDNQLLFEEEICKLCVLEPNDFDFSDNLAGFATALTDIILRHSGFFNHDVMSERLHEFDKEMLDQGAQISCIINEAFPKLDLKEIEYWTTEKTLWYYSRAKYIIAIRYGNEEDYLKSIKDVDDPLS